jgi:hypothetical protein
MTSNSSSKSSVINTVKAYLFPSLVSILAMMIWRDVNELRSDVKLLLAESNSNRVKVENLEKQVQQLNQAVFKMPRPISSLPKNNGNQRFSDVYACLNKEEHLYIVKKKELPYKTI